MRGICEFMKHKRYDLLRVDRTVKDFVDKNGYGALESLIKNSVKIDNQIKNYRMLQTKALESYDVAKKLNDQARKKMEGVSDQLIKEQFFDEFFNLGEDLLNAAKTSMNSVWIKAHEDKLKKMCRRM